MAAHLTDQQIADYWKCDQTPGELLAIDDHILSCEDCRRRLDAGNAEDDPWANLARPPFADPSGNDHLNYGELTNWVDGRSSGEDRARAEVHLRACESCREEVQDLQRFQAQLSQDEKPEAAGNVVSMPRRWWKLAVPFAAVAACGVVGVVLWQARGPVADPVAQTSRRTEPALSVSLKDSGAVVGVTTGGEFVGPSDVTAEDGRSLAAVLSTGSVRVSSLPGALRTARGILLGDNKERESFALTAPVGVVVLEDRPVFRWRAVPGDVSYRVQVFDRDFRVVAEQGDIRVTTWTSAKKLERGRTYSWQVTAGKGETELRAPVPPAGEARFAVLDEKQAGRIEAARNGERRSHLLLGVLYAQAGLVPQARVELRKLEEENPDSTVVKKLLAGVGGI
jgi:hypothetical protein